MELRRIAATRYVTPLREGGSLPAVVEADDDGLYVLYLMRQEIFLAEGRRMADLGIRLPIARTEVLANPNVDEGQPYTEAQVPPFIPGEFAMDSFTYDEAAKTVVIDHDMNRVLVQNKTSPFVIPFH